MSLLLPVHRCVQRADLLVAHIDQLRTLASNHKEVRDGLQSLLHESHLRAQVTPPGTCSSTLHASSPMVVGYVGVSSSP